VQRAQASTDAARAEGLTLKKGKSSAGYQGVFNKPRATPDNGKPSFTTIVDHGIGKPFSPIGTYWTAEEGALAFARYHRSKLITSGQSSGQPTAPAPPPPPVHTCPTAIITPPPPPALAATPAIPLRAADLNLSSKCIETWSQAANRNFRHAVSPAAPLGDPPLLATSRPVDTTASASTNAVPSEPANVQGSTGTVNAHSSATAQRSLSQEAEHAFRSQWDANLAPPPDATTGYAADGATSSAAPLSSPRPTPLAQPTWDRSPPTPQFWLRPPPPTPRLRYAP